MNEIFFIVEEAEEGGYLAKALDHPIFTEADTLEALKEEVKDAVKCHFDEPHHSSPRARPYGPIVIGPHGRSPLQ